MAGVSLLPLPFKLLKGEIMENENKELLNTEEEFNEEFDELSFDYADVENSSDEIEEADIKNWARELYEWVSSIAVAVVLALVVNTFLFSLVQVDGQSMVPTLNHGERLVVRKIAYEPKTRDVVIIKSGVLDKYIVKRVIALPGDEVSFDTGLNVSVNGEVLYEPYIASLQVSTGGLYEFPLTVPKRGEAASLEVIYAEMQLNFGKNNVQITQGADGIYIKGSSLVEDGKFTEGKTTYKQDCYFVMGDNRNNSSDSRTLGLIPDEEIMGEAIFRFMPFDKIGIIK